MPATAEICAHILATTTKIPDGFLLGRGWRHRREHSGPIEFREFARVATVGLDALARFARNQ